MAPGPSSTPSVGGEPTSSIAGPSSHSPRLERLQDPEQAVPQSRVRPPNSAMDEDTDLKHCAHCSRLLEGTMSTSSTAPTPRVVTIGSHAFVVSRRLQPSGLEDMSSFEESEAFTDQEGKSICRTCHDLLSRSIARSRFRPPEQHRELGQAMTLDDEGGEGGISSPSHTHPPVEESPDLASSTLTTTTPLSVSIGGIRRRSTSPETLGRRRESFTRSQALDSSDVTMSFASTPVVSMPSSSSSSSTEKDNVLAASNQRCSSPSTNATVSRGASIHRFDGHGPDEMTRTRLSTLPRSALRSHSPSASRLLGDYLQAPYAEGSTQSSQTRREAKEIPPSNNITWFKPHRPDPLRDPTRLRVPPQGRGCLYPGSVFRGTQKSGALSYDVTVEILNVDLPNSHLDGYLNIVGLTEDWPEMTTFFTAEIIGKEHGFVTDKWGATETDDMKHWDRFSAFKPMRSLAKRGERFNHMSNSSTAVFMRWKERFLVPDWKVRDIHGASFAGFYYVCIETGDMSEWDEEPEADEGRRRMGSTARPSSVSRGRPTREGPSAATSSRRLASASSAVHSAVAAADHDVSASPPRTRTPVSERRLGAGQYHSRMASLGAGITGSGGEAGVSGSTPWGPSPDQPDLIPPTSRDSEDRPRASLNVRALMDDIASQGYSNELRRQRGMRTDSQPSIMPLFRGYTAALLEARRRLETHSGAGAGTGTSTDPLAAANAAWPEYSSVRRPHSPFHDIPRPEELTSRPFPTETATRAAGSAATQSGSASTDARRTDPGPSRPSHSSGRITAYYYHANSEPYQQLDLRHVPQRSSASFEMR